MAARLIVGVLNVRSSFRSGEERPWSKGEAPDTVQWCVGEDGTAWRLRSYAFDHDLHALLCGVQGDWDADEAAVVEEMRAQYGDMLKSVHKIDVSARRAKKLLRESRLSQSVEVAPSGFAFWNPDGQPYQTQLAVL
jgi:hypothetical protein